jgi:hypothetical protein
MRNPVEWVNTELGKSSRDWKLRHWLAFAATVASAALIVSFR